MCVYVCIIVYIYYICIFICTIIGRKYQIFERLHFIGIIYCKTYLDLVFNLFNQLLLLLLVII